MNQFDHPTEDSASPALLPWDEAAVEEGDQVSARARVPSMPIPSSRDGWHRRRWGCAEFTWQRGPCPADHPTAVQELSLGGHWQKHRESPWGRKLRKTGLNNLARQVESGVARSRTDRFLRRAAAPQSFLQTFCAQPGPVLPRPDRLDVSPCRGHRTPRGCLGKAGNPEVRWVGGRAGHPQGLTVLPPATPPALP